MRISKALYLRRDSGMRLDLIAQAADMLNHTNFSAVNNIFPDTAVVNPVSGLTQSAIVPTQKGNVDLLNGPYRYTGFVPRSAVDLSSPLSFKLADPPRQISCALRFTF
jgi:hypothetical protein